MTQSAVRHHDFCAGHRVVGHEGKCKNLHGHNYRVHFYCSSNELDNVGRVIDFSVIKELLCTWVENRWDHKFLIWENDEFLLSLKAIPVIDIDSIVVVPFNPTAENMARYLLYCMAPSMLQDTSVVCTKVIVEETRKCSVEVSL